MPELLEIREIIEPRAAYSAAARANEAALREIEPGRLACEESVRRLDVLIETDPELHSAIIRAANKAILIDLHQSFRKRHAITVRTMRGWNLIYGDHRQIANVVIHGEPEAAKSTPPSTCTTSDTILSAAEFGNGFSNGHGSVIEWVK